MENRTVRLLVRNAVRCIACGSVLESTHRHDFVNCHCPNETACDGGLEYQRTLAVDLDLIEILSEYRTLTQEEYDKQQSELKAIQLAKNEQGVKDGLLLKIGGTYYNKEIISRLYDKGFVQSINLD